MKNYNPRLRDQKPVTRNSVLRNQTAHYHNSWDPMQRAPFGARYIGAAQLSSEWKCSLRTAQRAIERVPDGVKEKDGKEIYAPRSLITRRRPGRPSKG